MQELGLKIQREREKNNLSVDEMAKILKVTDVAVRLWENGKMPPKLSQLVRISQLFNVSTDYLLGIQKQ